MNPGRTPTTLWPSLLGPADRERDDLCLASASGHRVRFADGHEALCATSGLWNVNLGYGNEAVTDACSKAMRDASYLSVFRYTNTYARAAADVLQTLAGPDHFARVLFSTSGGAANDAVLKLVRHVHALAGHTGRKTVVGLRGSYHGLTYGSFSLTGENLGQQLYGVDPRYVRHVQPNAVEQLAELFHREGPRIAAVVLEPVLGSGTVVLDATYVDTVLALREEWGFLLVADEVATGFGRVGPLFASSQWSSPPDVLVTSKGLTNGASAAAAILVSEPVARRFDDAESILIHAETQAGTPVSCAAMLATAAEFDRLGAVDRGRDIAVTLDEALSSLAGDLPVTTSTAGVGLFRTLHAHGGVGPDAPIVDGTVVAALVTAIRRAGAVVHPGPGGIQLVPPLTYTVADVTELAACIRRGFDEVAERGLFTAATPAGAALGEAS